jgi:hypothetical protein
MIKNPPKIINKKKWGSPQGDPSNTAFSLFQIYKGRKESLVFSMI